MIVYTRLPEETRHVYHYARWDGAAWRDHEIVAAGRWFPRTPPGQKEREPHYSGGIALAPDDPSVVWLSRPVNGVFEIERWRTPDLGAHWEHEPVTAGSRADNVRPVAVRGAPGQVLWMHLDRGYEHYTRFGCSIRMNRPEPPALPAVLDPAAVRAAMERVGRWQLEHSSAHPPLDWTQGTLHAGLLALGRLSEDARFERAVLEAGRAHGWKAGPRPLHADDLCVTQAWLELSLRHRDPAMRAPARAALEALAAGPLEPLEWRKSVHLRQWAWCDALFMAPPALALLHAATGEAHFLDELDRRWWRTVDFLLDPDERLLFRDSRSRAAREPNGAKVFWSRGNGWVLAGLARLLPHLPAGRRARYEQLFVAMAERVAALQREDGSWSAGLLDREAWPAPETSGTGFFCFALAWGVNGGLLPRERFAPRIERAWAALVRAVDSNGMLQWVQPIGSGPRAVRAADTDVFGTGAFLLAGEQVHRLASR